ncbi:helix-turn-helix domain-containing protein [Clostridium botulinum]|uniref:Transcriptional regulator n=1 Tax=Clostridium botulinum TaxID=1491 RepID=A0A6B4JJQ5_CLOBO|nr:helix-turn-helix domain-containing protein [Clostridium botulinum]EES49789.1 putative prophage LambdaCh01, transcriptional regulator [Clostridium botulinum E1 str. 'BoNT E Beluga']MBY6760551.1 helix-turn-helix domain-containing protein [Clostridium botulinum]MBY6919458.1 helix-turn-helix domain-containing protein [Clostridium botulinum]MCR1130336.1 helix-turn-helix domain-containing protein [Clostridium botulinum]NFJ56905.1 transcriptional regulator [Clostridium botulinum]
MVQEYRNIYQIARESTGLTQEKASELLDVSVDSVRAYEGGKRVPPDRVVIKMIEIYNAQYLAYQHLKTSAEVGQKYLPNIEIKELPLAMLRLQKEVSDFIKLKDEMIEITCDGIIDDEEKPRWAKIMKELDDVVEAIMALKFAK